jgi:thiol-disulfide isomerase/thioredoxin
MPRFAAKAVLKPLPLAALAVATVVLAGVLYVILSGPVHALGRPPAALSRLQLLRHPRPAPDIAVADGQGRLRMLDSFRGHYLLVNLWATWCSPCVRELPALAALKTALKGQGLAIVAVNVGHADPKTIRAFLTAHGAEGLGVWRDPAHAFIRSFDAYGLPTSILIDPAGREIARVIGTASWDAPSAISYFRHLLATAPKPVP